MRRILSVIVPLLILFSFQNCSEVQFSRVLETEVGAVLKVCDSARANGTLQNQSSTITFRDERTIRTPVCQWGANGNLPQNNGHLASRFEQLSQVNVPAGAVICGIDLNFPQQTVNYDDHFFFTVNGIVMASNITTMVAELNSFELPVTSSTRLKLHEYDWDLLKGKAVGKTAPANYCVGEAEGVGGCLWPKSEETGTIAVNWDPAVVVAVGLKGASSSADAIDFGFVMTGDDNAATDCGHTPLEFTVNVDYYVP